MQEFDLFDLFANLVVDSDREKNTEFQHVGFYE